MTKIAITQPYLFPYIGYFQVMNYVDTYVFYDDVQYIRRGWINRNNILVNKLPNLFTISLDGASPNKMINEIHIKDDFVKFKKTLVHSYAKAPYKEPILQLVDRILEYSNKNLAEFTANSLKTIAQYLEIEVRFYTSSEIKKDHLLTGQDKIIAMSKAIGDKTYVNTYGGAELYDSDEFKRNDLELEFIKPILLPYRQFDNEFQNGLSIIDVMMFNGVEDIKKMLNSYEILNSNFRESLKYESSKN